MSNIASNIASPPDIETGVVADASVKPPREQLTDIAENTFIEIIAIILAVSALVVSCVALALNGDSTPMKISTILTLILAPYSVYQQRSITNIQAFIETHKALKEEVDSLDATNKQLRASEQNLKETVTGLEEKQKIMTQLQQTKSATIQDFRNEMEKNKSTIELMRKNVRAAALQNILEVVFVADGDNDQKISKKEENALIKSLREINGVHVDEKKFRKHLHSKDNSVQGVIDIIENMMDENHSAGDDTIFTFDQSS